MIAFTKGGGTAVSAGFKPGTDRIALAGYGDGGVGRALASAKPTGTGGATVTLSDNTRITVLDASAVGARSFG